MKYWIIVAFWIFALGSCGTFDESDSLPAFLDVSDVSIDVLPDEGAATHNITDIWMSADGEALGVFPLPSDIPVLFENGTARLDIFPGIRNNGIRSEAIIYPFYQLITTEPSLSPGANISFPLSFSYDPATQFRMVADFETENLFSFDEDRDGELNFDFSEEDPLDGQRSGSIEIQEIGQNIEIATDVLFELPNTGGAIFLEMDYKGDMVLFVGLTGVRDNTIFKNFLIGLRPQADWNKIYIDLSSEVAVSNLDAYRIILGTVLEEGNSGKIWFDNIKLLHF